MNYSTYCSGLLVYKTRRQEISTYYLIEMIYSILSLFAYSYYPFGSDNSAKVVFGITFFLTILISIIMLPINIRLAGQLVMQVFKYRYICNHVATMDEDNKVMTGYYNHFRAVMCIILAMVGFNVFNVISAVLFLVNFFKNAWGGVYWYWWIAQGLCAAFQECIILYAITMLYQVACYVQDKKFHFLTISVFIVIRFIYTSTVVGIFENLMLHGTLIFHSDSIKAITIVFWLFIPSLLILESSLRFPMVFSFIRVTQRSVSKYINDFINDVNTPYLDRDHFVVKIQAGKLFQIAGWGTICVSFLTSFVIVLQYLTFVTVFVIENNFETVTVQSLFLTVITIIQVITILPSILYSAFLVILWLYFRYKTKVKYSGYSSDDPIVLKLIHEPETDVLSNQDKFHYTYYKHKNRVMITTYVVCVVLVSVMFAGFFAPVLSEKWKWDISLKPGDYYLLENSVLNDRCPDEFSFTIIQSFSLNSKIDLNCSHNIFAGNMLLNEASHTTYKYSYQDYNHVDQVWIPENSTVTLASVSDLDIILQSQYPCYHRHGIYTIIINTVFENKLTLDSCTGAKFIQNFDEQNFTKCNHITNRGQQCKILTTGMYLLPRNNTVQQFGYTILEPTFTLLNKVKGDQLSEYDVILFKSSEIISYNYDFCSIQASCSFNPFFRILMPVSILLCSMMALAIGLFLIHKI